MIRLAVLLCIACVGAARPAFSQQSDPPAPQSNPPASQSDDLIDLLEASYESFVRDGNHVRMTGGLRGPVDMPIPKHKGLRLYADTVDIYSDKNLLIADGSVAFTTLEGRINAARIEFNLQDGTAKFYQAQGIMRFPNAGRADFVSQDPDVYFEGDLIEKRGPTKYVVTRGFFSTCVQPTPRWEVGGDKFTINLDQYVIATNMVLKVKGVPLLYLPALYYPIHTEGRSTGFLMPSFGTSTFRGTTLSNAFFWAIGRSQDATFFHDWFTRTGTGVGAEYRYLSGVGSTGLFRFNRFDQHEAVFEQNNTTTTLPAQTSYQVNAAVNQNLGQRVRAQGNVEYFSDVSTQQLYQQNTYERSSSRRTVSGGITGVYGPATFGGYYSRSEQFNDTDNSTVYGSTPRVTANIAPSKLFGTPVYASLSSEYLFQPNRRLTDGVVTADDSLARVDIAPARRVAVSQLSYHIFRAASTRPASSSMRA
jgi:lipopolysaccharide assembly outer membrane protein LptD (OstA)